jgi:excisionase family DNA binding protein
MKQLLSPKQVSRAIGVSESSLKRWCDKGLLPMVRTAGGHRRLAASSVLSFLRNSGHALAHPELLGLPANVGKSISQSTALNSLRKAILCGDEQSCRQIAFDSYLSGCRMVQICDDLLAPTLHEIGHAWECGTTEIFEERRACEIVERLLFELRGALPQPSSTAPTAIGGTLEGDPYRLPTAMIDLVLREAGWLAQSHGSSLPCSTMCAAIEKLRPRVFWLSVSVCASSERFLDDCATLWHAATTYGTALVVGGAALSGELRQRMHYSAFCDNLGHLVSFATALGSATSSPENRFPAN